MTDKENKWIKFYPSLELPKERVSIAYATHDERGYRFAYGYFQFYNGTCGCFWKDGNEQPKVVKAEDIKYWMTVPSLDVQEEPKECMYSKDNYTDEDRKAFCDGCDKECRFNKKEKSASEEFEKALAKEWQGYVDRGAATVDALEDNTQEFAFAKGFYRGANWQKEQLLAKAIDAVVKIDAGGYPYVDMTIELYDYDKDIPLAKRGDKVKILVIKES